MGIATMMVLVFLMALGLLSFVVGSFVLPVIMSIAAMQQHLEEERSLEEQADERREGFGYGQNSHCKMNNDDVM